MKEACIFLLLIISSIKLVAQSIISDLNAYRYVEIDPPTKGVTEKGTIEKEDLRLTDLMEELLFNKGFLLVPRDDFGRTPTYGGEVQMPIEVEKNRCLNLIWFWGFSPSDPSGQTLRVTAVNCRDEIIFRNSYRMTPGTNISYALRSLLAPVLMSNYHFDELLNHRKFIPRVGITSESEETLREYFSSHEAKPIEGIYKSIDSALKEDPAYYKIGIKFMNGRYQMIVLETDNRIWAAGEVKGYIENTETTNLYPASYYLSDKRKVEGFLDLNDIILTLSLHIKFEDFVDGSFIDNEKTSEIKFIKIFPVR